MPEEFETFDVVGLGQCSYDLIGRLDEYPPLDHKAELTALVEQGGGPVATALVTLSRLGVQTALLGRVGDDRYGDDIRRGLADEGVDCRGLVVGQGTSQLAFIAVDDSGHRNIFWHRGSVSPLTEGEIPYAMIGRAKVLHLDGLHMTPTLAAARHARDVGVTTVLDAGTVRPGIETLLPYIDHLVVAETFARQFAGHDDWPHALEQLASYGAEAITVTLGAQGSISRTPDGGLHVQRAFPVDVVDTTGCGDVFHGGYIYGLLQSWSLPQNLRFASACAALKTRQSGGRTAIPGLREVMMFLSFVKDEESG